MYQVSADKLQPDFSTYINAITSSNDLHPKTMLELQRIATKTLSLFSQVAYKPALLLAKTYQGLDFHQFMQDFLHSGLIAPEAVVLQDLCYCENLLQPLEPSCLALLIGSGPKFTQAVEQLFLAETPEARKKIAAEIIRSQADDPNVARYVDEQLIGFSQNKQPSGDSPVNLMVSHDSDSRFPPLNYIDQLSWSGLFGAVNYLTEQGSVIASHLLLEPGALRQANGGYLILNINDLIEQPHIWFKLKATLLSQTLDWVQDDKTSAGYFIPEPTPIHTRLILWGDQAAIAVLEQLEPELHQLAPLLADFQLELSVSTSNIDHYLGYLRRTLERENLPQLDKSAIAYLLTQASRKVEHQRFISLDKRWLVSLLKESWFYACSDGNNQISQAALQKAIEAQENRLSKPKQQSDLNIKENVIQLICEGEQVGQVIGLSVIEFIGFPYQFGEPIRITATTHMGEGDLSDVERKAELAGNIHAKAMMIIHGYLTHKLPLAGNLVFEQSYHEIDGDSASLAGLIALLSSMAEVPVVQHLAVTGAIDQFGHVQAVGGINEKIEGFYRVANLKNKIGSHGVVIPASNLPQLNLSQPVVDAVKTGRFTIYAIEHVEQAISLLLNTEAGSKQEPDSLFGIIHKRAQKLYDDDAHISWLGLIKSILTRR